MPLFELEPGKMEQLRKGVGRYCDSQDVLSVTDAYPGELTRTEIWVEGAPLDTQLMKCLEAVWNEKSCFATSFMLRLIERKWDNEKLRRDVVEIAPDIVQPPRGFDADIGALTAALNAMLDRLSPQPRFGDVGDDKIFRQFCNARNAIVGMAKTLRQLSPLKGIHDSLHMVQVIGAPQLDLLGGSTEAPIENLFPLFSRVRQAIDGATAAPDLPPDLIARLDSLKKVLDDSEQRLALPGEDDRAFGLAMIRSMLLREPKAIDEAMFAISRDFNIRLFCSTFRLDPTTALVQAALNAAINLADTLRRRLMEHSFWQNVDVRLTTYEQSLAQPLGAPLDELQTNLGWLGLELRNLTDDLAIRDARRQLGAALLNHDKATDPHASDSDLKPEDTFAEVRRAFCTLRNAVRSNFLKVDQTLKFDLGRLLDLSAPLESVLARVPRRCNLMVALE